jgi:hypothetical protein
MKLSSHGRLLFDLGKDLGIFEEEVLLQSSLASKPYRLDIYTHLVAELDRIAAPAWQENAIAGFDGHRDEIALFVWYARSDGDDGGLWERTGSCRGGEEDARGGFL